MFNCFLSLFVSVQVYDAYCNTFIIVLFQCAKMEPVVRYVFMASLLMQLVSTRAQADLDTLIDQVFVRPQTGGNSNNPESTAQENNQAEESEQDPLVCQCVPYYLCQNNTIITDGVGLIDIRSGFLPSNLPCPCTAYSTPG